MNEVEAHLRQSGEWATPIGTDYRGRATQGTWWPRYYAQWLDTHGDVRNETGLDPGGWTRDERGRDWWTTTTPDWDREWFQRNGVKPPDRFGDKANTYWKDYGDGLRGLSYRTPERPGLWTRLCAMVMR